MKHVLLALGMTVVPIIFIVLQQLSVGNIGKKTDGIVCGDFCSMEGYSGSGMPPRNSGDRSCICYDDSGNEAIKIPIDNIVQNR